MSAGRPYRDDGDGVLLVVRLTPRAGADSVGGIEHDAAGRAHLTAKVRAVPEKGRANAALERLIADWLGIAGSDVAVVAGGTARIKTLRLTGGSIAARLADRLGR